MIVDRFLAKVTEERAGTVNRKRGGTAVEEHGRCGGAPKSAYL